MADVYKVQDESGKLHALKLLHQNSSELSSQFEEEVRFLSKLKNPNLVKVEGFSKNGEVFSASAAHSCFWMEYVEGKNILELASSCNDETKLKWFREALQTLDYLHRQGILHGDIKAQNVLIDSNGKLRLLDFGMASLRGKSSQEKNIQGSLPYLAPEVLKGERSEGSDIFALGTLFYEVFSGSHPRAGAKNLSELFATPVPLKEKKPSLSPIVSRIIDYMIHAEVEQRFKMVSEILKALEFQESIDENRKSSEQSFQMWGVKELYEKALNFAEQYKKNALIIVKGEEGVGKSRFLRELFFELQLKAYSPLLHDLSENSTHDLYRAIQNSFSNSGIQLLEIHEAGHDHSLRDIFETLKSYPQVLIISLKALSFENSCYLFENLLKKKLSYELEKEMFELSRGNPRAIEEISREILRSGFLKHAYISPELFKSLQLPSSLEALYQKRIRELNFAEQDLLTVIALENNPVSMLELSELQKISLSELRQRFHVLLEMMLVVPVDHEKYQVVNSRVKVFLNEMCDLKKREQIHLKWAHYWQQKIKKYSEPLPAWLVSRGEQISFTTKPEISWILETGNYYFQRGFWKELIRLYARILDVSMLKEERDVLLRTLSNAYGFLGKYYESNQLAEIWFGEFPEDEKKVNPLKYFLSTAINDLNSGNPQKTLDRLEKALRYGNEVNPEHFIYLARIYSLKALLTARLHPQEDFSPLFEKALGFSPDFTEQRAEIYKNWALAFSEQGAYQKAFSYLEEAKLIYEKLSHLKGLYSVCLEKGNCALAASDPFNAYPAYKEALRYAEDLKSESLLSRVYQNLGVCNTRLGFLDAALEDLQKARELFVYFGNESEKALNYLQLALLCAHLGQFEKTSSFLNKVYSFSDLTPEVLKRKEEVLFEIDLISKGPKFVSKKQIPFENSELSRSEDVQKNLLFLNMNPKEENREFALQILKSIYNQLSDALKISFEDRADWKYWVLGKSLINTNSNLLSDKKEEDPMNMLQKLNAISLEMLSSQDMAHVLLRIMDVAMELSHAERGFLVVKNSEIDAPVNGFEIKVARNMAKEMIEDKDVTLSFSALQEALKKGEIMWSDNAKLDDRFQNSISVHQLNLKSILVIPLKDAHGVMGALYLDHRYEVNTFREVDREMLQVFADQAALALQKAKMIEDLRNANRQLSQTVEVQESEISVLKREVKDQRVQLAHEYKEIIGQSPAMLEVLSLVDRVTDTTVPVWIYGESGTGKEMIARALHFNSARSKKAFVSENCSALPETLLESELFGHKKGAFTHADRDKKGLLEYADGGTVFLDEIADMSPAMQAKLLRFLQEGEIRPLGSNEVINVDVRVVSASNKDLSELIAEGKFREDLFYRLNGVTVTLPPLRDRLEDLPLLAQHFLKKLALQEHKEPCEISPEALELLMDYSWPGNVRELENTLRTASLFQQKGKLLPKSFHFKKNLQSGFRELQKKPSTLSLNVSPAKALVSNAMPEEKRLLVKALYDHGYHKGLAAEALGISRRYLYTQMMKYNVPISRVEMKAYVESYKDLISS